MPPSPAPPGRLARAGSTSRGLSRWLYYLTSIPTILAGIRPVWKVLGVFAGLPLARPVTLEVAGGARFRVRTRMEIWILKESCLDRDYERGEVAVRPGWTVVDIGAGLGDFAVRVARESPNSRVYAFEPLPESFALLEQNVRLNGATNLFAFPEAVAGRPGRLTLYSVTGLSGQHRTAGVTIGGAASPIEVSAVDLEEVLSRLPAGECDFLKIDCEGAEYEILFAAPDSVLARIRHLALEYHDAITEHSHQDLVRFLEQKGFVVRLRPSPAYEELGFLYASRRTAGTLSG